MGMDVCGKDPINEVGKYFRSSVWWWHPLWDYCCAVAEHVTSKVRYGHSNDGDGLDKEDSLVLAKILAESIESGATVRYEKEYAANMDAMPSEVCRICAGTGKRADAPMCGAGSNPCNGCNSTGSVRPHDTQYPFSTENVKEFILFLESCGGFEIH